MTPAQYKSGYTYEFLIKNVRKDNDKELLGLLNYLSCFDTINSIEDTEFSSELSVIHNLIVRGIPTIPSIFLVESIHKAFPDYFKKKKDLGAISYDYAKDKKILKEALYIIDPRYKPNIDSYPVAKLDSGFEVALLLQYISQKYIIQLLHCQRKLSELVPPNQAKKFTGQRVDFSLEEPYYHSKELAPFPHTTVTVTYRKGLVIEADGDKYHKKLKQVKLDWKRDNAVAQNKWDSKRINDKKIKADLFDLNKIISKSEYLPHIKKNYNKDLTGDWLNTLQVTLIPFSVARIQNILCRIISVNEKETVRIVVLERDVPCGYLAIEDFKQQYTNLSHLKNDTSPLPEISLEVYTTEEFKNSEIHELQTPTGLVSDFANEKEYDYIIDISVLLRSGLLKEDYERGNNWIIIRSAHYDDKKSPRRFKTTDLITYKSIVYKERGSFNKPIKDVEKALCFFLQNVFRKESFRVGQLPILHQALQNKTVIGLLPTGGGKSLTYQLAAILQPGITLVIDPIKSLMQDQYDSLVKIGIDGCNFINSSLGTLQRKYAIDHLQKGEILFSFLSPERLLIDEFRTALKAMFTKGIYFSYCVIDEVHCLSEWGHDFRTAYLMLGRNAREYCKTKSKQPIALFGLTATASYDVLADIERELSTTDTPLGDEALVRYENTTRNEVQYNIIKVPSVFGEFPLHDLPEGFPKAIEGGNADKIVGNSKLEFLKDHIYTLRQELEDYNQEKNRKDILAHAYDNLIPFEEKDNTKEGKDKDKYINNLIKEIKLDNLDQEFFNEEHSNAGIVFCPHKKETATLGVLRFHNDLMVKLESGWFMGSSNMPKPKEVEKTSMFNQQKFINNELDIMVATKAFGMGIDKPNVRFTYHVNYPNSIESFVQEGGRTGRDRKLSIVNLLYNDDTFYIHRLSKSKIKGLDLSGETKGFLEKIRYKLFSKDDFDNVILPMLSGENPTYKEILLEQVFEEKNVDKDVLMFFHQASFRGERKELTALNELLNTIYSPIRNNLSQVAEDIKQEYKELDFLALKPHPRDAPNRIYVNSNLGSMGSFKINGIGLNAPWINPKFGANEILNQKEVLDKIRGTIVSKSNGTPIIEWIKKPTALSKKEGILHYLTNSDISTLIIPFENALNNVEYRKERLRKFTTDNGKKIAVPTTFNEPNHNPFRYTSTHKSFIDMVVKETTFSEVFINALPDTQKEKLDNLFYLARDDKDTAKAIYRLYCIGIIKDYQVDYRAGTFTVQLNKLNKGGYKKTLQNYLMRYYSETKVDSIINEINTEDLKTEIESSLKVLIEFVYDQIAKKRKAGIEDMERLCVEGLNEKERKDKYAANKAVKEFIYTYFNSKYAREMPPYEVDGKTYSLSKDIKNNGKGDNDKNTKKDKISDWDIVSKYMKVVGVDSSGSFDDNVKHLRGATLRLLRADIDNPALLWLKGFALIMLYAKSKREEFRTEAEDEIFKGAMIFMEDNKNDINHVISLLQKYRDIVSGYSKDDILTNIITSIIGKTILRINNEWLSKVLKPKFL